MSTEEKESPRHTPCMLWMNEKPESKRQSFTAYWAEIVWGQIWRWLTMCVCDAKPVSNLRPIMRNTWKMAHECNLFPLYGNVHNRSSASCTGRNQNARVCVCEREKEKRHYKWGNALVHKYSYLGRYNVRWRFTWKMCFTLLPFFLHLSRCYPSLHHYGCVCFSVLLLSLYSKCLLRLTIFGLRTFGFSGGDVGRREKITNNMILSS